MLQRAAPVFKLKFDRSTKQRCGGKKGDSILHISSHAPFPFSPFVCEKDYGWRFPSVESSPASPDLSHVINILLSQNVCVE